MQKDFEGQYSDEKLLFKSHENMLSFFFDKSHVFVVYIVLWGIVAGASIYITTSIILGILAFIFICFLYTAYMSVLFRNTWIIITPRRVIELTQNGLLKKHRRELKLMDIKATSAKRWVIGTIFWFSELTIKWTEEDANIYFKGIKWWSDIANYVSRIIDYIKTNGHEQEISRYVPKKQRKK